MSDQPGVTQTLLTATAVVASGNSGAVALTLSPDEMTLVLDVTTAETGVGTLDVYLQTSHDGGTTWTDFAHFTQVTTAAVRRVAGWSVSSANNAAGADTTTGDAVLAAGKIINGPIVSAQVRVKYVIGVGTGSYTFVVRAILSKWRDSSFAQTGPV